MGARSQPLLLLITTAGTDIGCPCYAHQRDLEQVLEGVVEDDQRFGIIYTVDEGDDWTSEDALIKANPNWGVSILPEFLLAQQAAAIRDARKQATFQTKHLDMWVASASPWVPMEMWRRGTDKTLKIEDLDRVGQTNESGRAGTRNANSGRARANHEPVGIEVVLNGKPVPSVTGTSVRALLEDHPHPGRFRPLGAVVNGRLRALDHGLVSNCRVDTVEALAGSTLHPLQEAFLEHAVAQCGYCIPGMLLSMKALLDREPTASAATLREVMTLCRCTGYAKPLVATRQYQEQHCQPAPATRAAKAHP